jgi:diguanylate cyclase (GGDEF)-like protein
MSPQHNGQTTGREPILSPIVAKVWRFLVRHRFTIQDLGLLLAALLVAAYVAFEVDIFITEGAVSEAEKTIELNEALLLGALLAVGLFVFAVRRYFEQQRELMRRIAAERKAHELAYLDPLTGLPNRRQFEEALRVAAASPPTAGGVHAVLMLDLNGFKHINDTYGHGLGDEVLVVVAQRLLSAVREGDLVARLGGDEFVVLARHLLGPEGASNIALRIIHNLADEVVTGNLAHQLGAGIGIALLPTDAQTAEESLRKADVALYRAKAERRSAFHFFEEDMDRLVREREQMEQALKRAIEDDLIEPAFRPSFDLKSGAVVGFEAIPHWVTADGEAMPPERFLPIAEETGLIHRLGKRLLEQACFAATSWPAGVVLSIDVLPGQLKDRELGYKILDVAADAGLDCRRLEVEIAESALVRDLDAAKVALAPLTAAGVSIALDNFGTGYSNLYHIQEFKLDKVKIDRRFTEKLGDEETARLVRGLAGLGHGLGLTVSAHGGTGLAANAALMLFGVEQGQHSNELLSADATKRLFPAAKAFSKASG